MIYLSEKDMVDSNLINMQDCIRSISDMYEVVKKQEYQMGGLNANSHGTRLQINIEDKENIFIAMPAYLGGKYQVAGVKFHGPNRYIEGANTDTNHMITLYDALKGVPIAILKGNILTTYRTAAVSAYATEKLLKNKPVEVGIIGPGRINTVYTEWLLSRYASIKKVKILGRGLKSKEVFISKITEINSEIDIQICDSFEEVTVNSDILSVITGFEFNNVADMPYIRSKWIKSGALILCPSFIKFSNSFVINEADIAVDNYKMYESYASEMGYPVYKKLSNLGNLVVDLVHEDKLGKDKVIDLAQEVELHLDNDKPVVFSSGGMGIEDVAVGYDIVKKAAANGIGVTLEY